MSGPSNGVAESPLGSPAAAAAAAGLSETRPLYWSVRRELWECRSIYVGPLVAAGVFLFGYLISMVRLPQRRRAALLLDAAEQHAAITKAVRRGGDRDHRDRAHRRRVLLPGCAPRRAPRSTAYCSGSLCRLDLAT